VGLVRKFGPIRATDLATTLRLKLQQPLQESRVVTGESGKSYTKRGARRKLLSGSPAASKKRLQA
jgi:hypothetical protein